MIWSSLIKFQRQDSHHVALQYFWFTPHFSQYLVPCSRSLRILLTSLPSLFTDGPRRHLAVQGRGIGTLHRMGREIYLCTLVAVSVLAERLNITRLLVSAPTVFIVMLPRQGRVRSLTPCLTSPMDVGDPTFTATSGQDGCRFGAKSAFVADGKWETRQHNCTKYDAVASPKKRSRSFSTPASRVFIKPPLNSLGLCDESVAEFRVWFGLVTR
jgi:hypothetical protein